MKDSHQYSKVPKGRLSRLTKLGSLASKVATGMVAEGVKQLAAGHRPKASELLLTPKNAQRVADQLAQLRGAAMKVGQLLSMDAGDLLPKELTELLSRLQADAKPMPISQLNHVLIHNWGEDWQDQFAQFSFYPVAAASIGQVHRAKTKDGRDLALKIQYPGIGESIDSDVHNVSTLLNLSGLIPKSIDVSELLEEAKKQLHTEADYQQEANYLKSFSRLMADDPRFLIPEIYDDLTCETILAMSFVEGIEIEQLAKQPQEVRDEVMSLAFTLLFKEVFEFRLVQTDPNFANYRYNPETKQFILLDFGATRAYPEHVAEGYRQLMSGAITQDRDAMLAALKQIGFFHQPIEDVAKQAVVNLCLEACEPLAFNGEYDFGVTDMGKRIRDAGSELSMNSGYWHTPPADAIFLHRKLGGLYLLAAKLKARVNVYSLFKPYMIE
ncbi:ABC1 kinase family protein [Photobacterium leiognathi]|uniref:ABC1 kinase family protein n=1 Tax=Photobacterium leiognathi TaxID=553611 RepID=UPI0029815C19|nr:AarF/ABC1/UbiB kinase family protein [Photobacterium leiognathi]